MVTVVMPVRNEAAFIVRSLGAVLEQDYPPERMEVIVVDGGSVDDTPSTVKSMALAAHDAGRSNVFLLHNAKGTTPVALNLGIERAGGSVIVRVDSHCVVPRDYVRQCVRTLRVTGADNVGGIQRAYGTTPVGRAVAAAMSSRFGGGARFHYARRAGWSDTVYLGCFPREIFARVGAFDEEMVRSQDAEFNRRLRQAGGRIWLDPELGVDYHCRETLAALFRQYFGYGFFKARIVMKTRGLASPKQFAAPALVVALTGSLVAATVTGRAVLALAALAPYFGADAAASGWTGSRRLPTVIILPAVFATMHLAWGLGFLRGLWTSTDVDTLNRRRNPGSGDGDGGLITERRLGSTS
jgi:GT2 family glycosyltransferase